MQRPMTNLYCVTAIMTFSQYCALAQAFVMDASSKHASHIAAMPPKALKKQFGDNPMISAEAWHAVAREIHEKVEAHVAP